MTGLLAQGPARRLAVATLLGLALLLSACTGTGAVHGGGATQGASGQVHRLASIETLKDAFNADKGATRLVLLISPT